MALVIQPPYAPELNPVKHLWDELREKEFTNQVFDTLGAAIAQAVRGLKQMADNHDSVQSITGWDWTDIQINMIAIWNKYSGY